MPKTLLTGATGFIGSHLARALVERGDDLRVTVRDRSPVEVLEGVECERVRCDVTDRRAVRRALKGVDRVFHAAGVTSIREGDAERMFEVNVGGTKTVLGECLRAEVERVVFTSSAAALGPAPPGGTADESQLFTAGHLDIPYVNSVHEAEVEAMRLAARGLPLVCVNPAATFGSGDFHVTSTRIVRNFLLGRVPMYSGGAFCMVDVGDVVTGHLLADELGGVAERYILGGRNFTFDRFFADLGRISGVAPPVRVPGDAGHGRRPRAGCRRAAAAAPDGARRGAALVDLPRDEGQARAELARAAPRGDPRGHGGLAPGARARPHRAHPPLAAAPVPADGSGAGRRRPGREDGRSAAGAERAGRSLICSGKWRSCTAVRHPPTACAAVGSSPGG